MFLERLCRIKPRMVADILTRWNQLSVRPVRIGLPKDYVEWLIVRIFVFGERNMEISRDAI